MDGRGNSRSVILCVDDHWAALELRKRVLEKAGYTALVATTARKALEIFRTRRVDLVLTEHVAPAVVDGPTFTATMKVLKPEVPIAIFSADVSPGPEYMRFADVFITKLVPVVELLRIIKRLLIRRATVQNTQRDPLAA